nr:prepilin-type N-terminal cleavage/methylation domain-containing protein [Fertoeibacter niger]
MRAGFGGAGRTSGPQGARLVRPPQAGITLIEVLIVLVVIGVASGATLLGVNAADRGTGAAFEAQRLAQRLALGVDEALVAGAPLALVWDAGGYRFLRWQEDEPGWQPAAGALGARHELAGPLELSSGKADPAPVLISASATGRPQVFAITGRGAGWQVLFDGFSARAVPEGGA